MGLDNDVPQPPKVKKLAKPVQRADEFAQTAAQSRASKAGKKTRRTNTILARMASSDESSGTSKRTVLGG